MDKRQRIASLSYLRIAATVGVVLLHACSTLIDNPELFLLGAAERVFFQCAIKVMTWCVPCFLMITGSLLLGREGDIGIRDCLKKYVRRMLLALILFGMPFALLMEYSASREITLAMFPRAIVRILTNQSFAHLWYVYMVMGIYLLLPIIKRFTDSCTRQLIRYVLIVLFAFDFVLPVVSALTNLPIAFEIPVRSCFLFYFLMGHYICHYRPRWAANVLWAGVGVALCVALIVVACVVDAGWVQVITDYAGPLTAVLAVCVFNLFGGIKRPVTERLWALDRLAFGVYLIHPVFIHLLYRVLRITPTGSLFAVKTFAVTCAVTALSFAGSLALGKVPPLKKYVM